MPLFLVAALVVLAIVVFFWSLSIVGSLIGAAIHLIAMLVVAGIVGWLADLVVPGRLPWGWLGAVFAGLLGGLLGTLVLGSLGPEIFGVRVIPAFLGAVVLTFASGVR